MKSTLFMFAVLCQNNFPLHRNGSNRKTYDDAGERIIQAGLAGRVW